MTFDYLDNFGLALRLGGYTPDAAWNLEPNGQFDMAFLYAHPPLPSIALQEPRFVDLTFRTG
jgi:hypothetical protein